MPMDNSHEKDPHHHLTVLARNGESDQQAIARVALTSAVSAACTISDLTAKQLRGLELDALVDQLGTLQAKATGGDLEDCQAMLLAQAHTLDALFHKLTRKAFEGGDLEYARTCLQLALKAQNGARNTVATLATVQQPKAATFIRQANLQVNNGLMPETALPVAEPLPSLPCEVPDLENELCPTTPAS